MATFAVVLSVVSCTNGDDEDEPMATDVEPLPTTASGPVLCDFVPEDAVRVAIGRDEVTSQGSLRVQGEAVAGAQCRVFAEGAADPALDATIWSAHDFMGERVLEVLASGEVDYVFPDALGPGYGHVIDSFVGENGIEGRGGAVTMALWGDNIIQVAINDQAEGRDAMADAVALTQQIAQVLELPKEPSQPYPTP